MATVEMWKAKFFDVSKAFLRAPIRERAPLEPPAECREYCVEKFDEDP